MKGWNMLKYWLTLCLAVITVLPLAAAPKEKKFVIPADVPKSFNSQEMVWVKSALSQEKLQEDIAAVAKEFLQSKELHIGKLQLKIQKLKALEKYYFLEFDTKISRRWVVQNVAFAKALLNARSKMNNLAARKKTGSDEYRRWYEYYTKTARQYWTVSRRPIKITDRRYLGRLARIKKAVLERELAKEQAQDAKKPVLDEKKFKKK